MTRRACYLTPHQMFLLDLACKPIQEAYGHAPYLVGTATQRPDYRDVDVRLILPDDEYADLVPTPELRTMLAIAFTAYPTQVTGLPIDFGIQQQTAANRDHPGGWRNPLGRRHLTSWTGDAPPADTAPED